MNVAELGRFYNAVENKKPSDFAENIPAEFKESCVGLFWHVGSGKFIICSTNILDDVTAKVHMAENYEAEENPHDVQIDYATFHKDVWQEKVVPQFPELVNFDVDFFSRGRIIYEVAKNHFTIFIPRSEKFSDAAITFLAQAFHLPEKSYSIDRSIYHGKKDLETLTGVEFKIL